ncbi:MAG: methyltransferase domain-containing protein [Deltaproteobacteria bacterium]|nr:methyltransferase domain-containing protein [Deltaproteobacteria bacterium]MCX5855414.1 methyltransferase domain-containing protein [Deltaproteobacteria bacterium]
MEDKYNKEIKENDRELTLRNKNRLLDNKNLLFWYKKLFAFQFYGINGVHEKKILETGSGTSPMKFFYNHVITSDILDLDYLDIIFDCHDIDACAKIEYESLDLIVATNVLHHLKDPLKFLLNASLVLKKGGAVLLTEPYFSILSKFIYERIHHEYTSFDISEPRLKDVDGPLSSANIALPFMIFFGHKGWDEPLNSVYKYDAASARHFSSLSYMMTGGISRKLPIPLIIYKCLFQIDLMCSQIFPKLFSSFFVIRLEKI